MSCINKWTQTSDNLIIEKEMSKETMKEEEHEMKKIETKFI